MSRTYKRPYTKSKRFDTSCRNDGNCEYCRSNRLYAVRNAESDAKDQEKDYKENDNENED
jgi:hypothetical protein